MSNYARTFQSALWADIRIVNMTSDEKVVYFLLLTAEFSSDISLYPCAQNNVIAYSGLTRAKVKKILEKFEAEGLIQYDYKTQEVLVMEYFWNHPPVNGLYYEMFKKDFHRIHSERLLLELAENAKKYPISIAFFAALKDRVPSVREQDYQIKPSKYTEKTIRTAAARGRAKSGVGITAAERKEILQTVCDALDMGELNDEESEEDTRESIPIQEQELPF